MAEVGPAAAAAPQVAVPLTTVAASSAAMSATARRGMNGKSPQIFLDVNLTHKHETTVTSRAMPGPATNDLMIELLKEHPQCPGIQFVDGQSKRLPVPNTAFRCLDGMKQENAYHLCNVCRMAQRTKNCRECLKPIPSRCTKCPECNNIVPKSNKTQSLASFCKFVDDEFHARGLSKNPEASYVFAVMVPKVGKRGKRFVHASLHSRFDPYIKSTIEHKRNRVLSVNEDNFPQGHSEYEEINNLLGVITEGQVKIQCPPGPAPAPTASHDVPAPAAVEEGPAE